MMAADTEIEEVIVALKQLTETIEDLLNYGRNTVKIDKGSVEEFIDGKIGKMFGFVSAYQKCLTSLGVKTKHDMEQKLGTYVKNRTVREISIELLDLEQEWDIFLSDIDKVLADDCRETVQLGQTGPIHDNLIDGEISAVNGKVVVITFGLREGALRWLEDVKTPFPVLMDHHRKLYHFFGLKRSVIKVWGVSSLVFYAEAMVAGRQLPKPYENVHDDPNQMGGNFILDKHGVTRFLYPSKTSLDRPEVELLLQQLEKINNEDK